tara:strand:- start:671 stop:1399 length:729 start_codon:yes stop_codon:yes gene_type:complete
MHRSLRRTVRSLRAEARVDQRGDAGRVRGTVLLYLERPDRVRFDAMTQFGPAAVLTSDGDRFQLLDHREERFIEGEACPENIARLLGIHMSGPEVAHFLVGDTPRLEAEDVSLACSSEGYLVIRTASDGRRQEIVLTAREADHDAPPEAQHLRLVRSELFDVHGETIWRATYDDYRVVRDPGDAEGRGVALPFVLRFEDPVRGADTMVRFKDMSIVVEPAADEVFQQRTPPGMRAETILCGG